MKISTRNARRIREGIKFGRLWDRAHQYNSGLQFITGAGPTNPLGALAAERTVITLGRKARLAKQKERA